MIETAAPLVAGAVIGALAVTIPDLVSDVVRSARARRAERAVTRAERAVVRAAEQLLRENW